MLSLAERFQSGRLSARDAQRIIGAGLRGAGNEIRDEAVGRMQAEGGVAGFVDIVARLLGATFGGPIVGPIVGAVAGKIASSAIDATRAGGGARPRKEHLRPFPWSDVMAAGLGLLRLPPAALLVHDPARAGSRPARPRSAPPPTRRCPAPRSRT